MDKQLLILGCSETKKKSDGLLPAIARYDGPAFRVLRTFLREYEWPKNVSIGVLSAEHGLFGVLKGINDYNLRMTKDLAAAMAPKCCGTLEAWGKDHDKIHLSLGKEYLPAVSGALDSMQAKASVFEGQIGMKLHQEKNFLESTSLTRRITAEVEAGSGKLSYFLPDWDDLLDPNFDFAGDSFSGTSRGERSDKHCSVLMQPERMCDGILVSLAQHCTSKGPLRRLNGTEAAALAPVSLKTQFGLSKDQWLFGDCGAFSYLNENEPTISVEQAVALYDVHGFDFGASVDHIPVQAVEQDGVKRTLTQAEREIRVQTTRTNAGAFITAVRDCKAKFNPVGTIQALTPEGYAESVRYYCELGYRHLAIGGLVPLGDSQIEAIVKAVMGAATAVKVRPWVHLFGVFRPNLQEIFRTLKVDSFDSATYFRKAWLRSDQNYLAKGGEWYAALRVPMTSDGRTRKKLEESLVDIEQLEQEELNVLDLLCEYDKEKASLDEVLDAVLDYDRHLTRTSEHQSMRERYRHTLNDRPWLKCDCPFCAALGIHILIFRGTNRNKRRGAHNTLMLYGSVTKPS